nr:MAG TPA: hypothetical protein [Caudoviricetes sp.]
MVDLLISYTSSLKRRISSLFVEHLFYLLIVMNH